MLSNFLWRFCDLILQKSFGFIFFSGILKIMHHSKKKKKNQGFPLLRLNIKKKNKKKTTPAMRSWIVWKSHNP